MVNIEEIYRKLTNVNINEQKLLWDERGRGYYGEFLVFYELYPHLSGNCKILMNVNIPTQYGNTTEIDLLLIHETGIYVFEMKHYKGTIYGKPHDPNWTQYFRTAPNQHFRSPVAQNQYHIDALKKVVPGLPVQSYIVFTSDECNLKVDCNEPDITVCTLSTLHFRRNSIFSGTPVLTMEQIDHIFRTLLTYSPAAQQTIVAGGTEIPFHEFASAVSTNYIRKVHQLEDASRDKIEQVQKECQSKIVQSEIRCEVRTNRMRGIVITSIAVAIIAVVASIVISALFCNQYQEDCDEQITAAQQKVAVFAQKFELVGDYNNGDIQFSTPLVTASKVALVESADLVKTVKFSCTLNWVGDDYGVRLTPDTKYIILLKDGSVREYNLYNADFHCYPSHKLGKNSRSYLELPEREFYKINPIDIVSIKLADTEIWRYGSRYGASLFSGYEIELYRAE